MQIDKEQQKNERSVCGKQQATLLVGVCMYACVCVSACQAMYVCVWVCLLNWPSIELIRKCDIKLINPINTSCAARCKSQQQ